MQVVAAMYRRFIHQASLTRVAEKYKSIRYSRSNGVEGLFDSLKSHAKRLPTPPDMYNFKQRLLLLLPSSMADDLERIHNITAEKSTLYEIMEAVIAVEQSEKACQYYQEARKHLEVSHRRRSRSRSRRRRSRS